MLSYIFRRLIYVIPIALGVTIVCFSLVYIGPGDPLSSILPEDAPQSVVDKMKHDYGLDKPIPLQYVIWLGKAMVGNFGTSIVTGRPVLVPCPIAIAPV